MCDQPVGLIRRWQFAAATPTQLSARRGTVGVVPSELGRDLVTFSRVDLASPTREPLAVRVRLGE